MKQFHFQVHTRLLAGWVKDSESVEHYVVHIFCIRIRETS